MKLKFNINLALGIFVSLLPFQKVFSQCFQIESILVNACDNGTSVPVFKDEGYNEMVRFKVGGSDLNTNFLTVNWSTSNSWLGLVQDATTASKVATLNADILSAGGCGKLIEPTGGVLPANAKVILVTGSGIDTKLNAFGAITEDFYIIFQKNQSNPDAGHFGNSSNGSLKITFTGFCSDTVNYLGSNLISGNGSTVNFTPSGTPSYVNNGCVAPVGIFTVDAGTTPISGCPGSTVSLSGTAQGQQSVSWSDGGAGGTFTAVNSLNTNYVIGSSASGTIVLTLTATSSCGTAITDTVTLNVSSGTIPTFNPISPICQNATAPVLPTSSTNSPTITGTWSPAVSTATIGTTTYTFTPSAGQCATQATTTITVNPPPSITSTTPGSRCGTGTVTLGATSSSGIINWYAASTGGSSLGTGTSYTTPSISSTTTYWAEAVDGSCISSTRTSVEASVVSSAPLPTVAPVEYCQGSSAVALTATPLSGATLNWYGTNATGGTASSVAPVPSTTTVGNTTYYVSQTVGSCESARASIVVKVVGNTGGKVGLFCDNANSTTTSVALDWGNPIGWAGYTYSYSIAGGSLVTGTHISPSNFTVPVSTPGTSVTFTILSVLGLPCAPAETVTCFSKCSTTVAPNFASIPAICSGDTSVPTLATTSPNAITGTWSPSTIDNTTSQSYVFTPDPTSFPCASKQTLNVTVNSKVTPTFTGIPSSLCQGASAPILPTTSSNSITGTWSPSSVDTSTIGTTTYTFTPTTGLCAVSNSVTITINSNVTPSFSSVGPICSGTTLSALPTTSTNAITGAWSPALNNTATTTYTFTPTAGQCATTNTLTITVNPKVTPSFAPVGPICSGDTLNALPTTSTNAITGTWSPALNNTTTTSYTFTPTSGLCANTATLIITVNQKAVPAFASVAPICSGGTLLALPTTSTNGITGSWSPALDNTATTSYTFTPTAGLCATTAVVTITVNQKVVPTFAAVGPICSGATLSALPTTSNNGIIGTWTPALNNTTTTTYTFTPNAGQCATPTTLTITVNPVTTPTFSSIGPLCSGTIISLPTTSINGIEGSWSPAFNPSATTVYTFTPGTGQCAATTKLTISIIALPIATATPKDSSLCSDTATSISLSSNTTGTTYLWNVVQTNVTGALAGSGDTIVQTLKTAVENKSGEAVYSITPTANGCPGLPILATVTVNPIPDVTANPSPATVCSGERTAIVLSSKVAGTTFSWTTEPLAVIGSFPDTGSTIAQTLVTNSVIPGTVDYTITPTAATCVGLPITVTVTVNPTPEVFGSGGTIICSGESTNIILSPKILGTDFTWTVVQDGVTGAEDGGGSNTIDQVLEAGTTVGTAAYTITPILNGCKGNPITIVITVNPSPQPVLEDGIICVQEATGTTYKNYLLDTGLSDSLYDFNWFKESVKISGASESTYEATAEGLYSVIATNTITSCVSQEVYATVIPNYPGLSLTTIVTDAFTPEATISVDVLGGTGPFLYRLDDGPLQSSNVFVGVSSGVHKVWVEDGQGCTNLSREVTVIDYPRYFTPNGDGFNDSWNVVGLNDQPEAKIYIFDRYGKLLKQISTIGEGWNGTFNGHELPATDYWFTIEYLENNSTKVFKAHFALKR